MTIFELAEVSGLEIRVVFKPTVSKGVPPWLTHLVKPFGTLNIKESIGDGILSSSCGYGDSPEASIKDYIDKIRGKVLAIDSSGGVRSYVNVPEGLI